VVWTDVEYEEAFSAAEVDGEYFRSMQFDVCREDELDGRPISTGLVGVVTRNGHLATNQQPLWLRESGVSVARERALADFRLSQGRSRQVAGGAPSLPRGIVAEFAEGVSIEVEDVRRLASLLGRMKAASVSILHGNPYLRATVVDSYDGSAFDLVLTSERRMLIVPQLRATESAVSRICRFIYEQVGEAEFGEVGGR